MMKNNNKDASDSGSSQFEQVNMTDIPDIYRDSMAYRASMAARIGDANDVKTLKQKVKVLKAAVLKEREIKIEMEKKMLQLTASFEESQKQLEKKDETIIYQEQQLQVFREKLIQLGHESNNDNTAAKQSADGDSMLSTFKSIIGFSSGGQAATAGTQNAVTDIQRIQKENFMLKEEIEKQKMALTSAEQKGRQEAVETSKKQILEINKKVETLNHQNQEFKDKIVTLTTQLQQQTADLKEKEQSLNQLREEVIQKNKDMKTMENELEFARDKIKKLDANSVQYLDEIATKAQKIVQISSQFESLKVDKENLQKQVDTMEEKIMIFTLKKYSGLTLDPCQIICRKDLEGQHVIDFDSIKEKFSLNVLDLADVFCQFEPEPILTFQLSKNRSHIFKGGADLSIVEKKIRNFVEKAPTRRPLVRQQTNTGLQNNNNNNNNNTNTPNNNNQQNQGFLDNVYGFFK